MRRRVASFLLAQFLMLAALLCGATGAAHASGDNQRFFIAGRVEEPTARLLAAGVLNGAGTLTAESVEFQQADSSYRETDLAVVGAGTLELSINGRFSTWPFTLDPGSCTQRGTLSGTWTVAAARGDLTGTTGHGTFTGRFLTYAARGPAGCDESAIKGFVAGPMTGTLSRHAGR